MINETKEAAIAAINDMLAEENFPPLTEQEARDWGIEAGMTNAQLSEMVSDLRNEFHSELCAVQHEWRYIV